MELVRIYFKSGDYVDIKTQKLELNRIVDEILLINTNDIIIGRFNISAIAGYIIMR